jgi:predicted TIM-barrel fold metal-dependent hydrolase
MDFAGFADVPIVDGHVHFSDPERMEDLLELMDIVPMMRANLVSTPNSRPVAASGVNHNPALIAFKARHPGRVYLSGGLDYVQAFADRSRAAERLGAQVRTLKRIGFDGLKLIEGKPTARRRFLLPLDAPEYEGMWAALEASGLPVVWHVADPEEFWDPERCPPFARERGWCYADDGYPSKESLYAEVDHVLARHPRLRIIFAHFYFLSADLERAERFLDAHPTVCFDLTPGSEMYDNFTRNYDAARAFFLRYQDRLVYGTDISSRGLARDKRGSLALAWLVRASLERDDLFTVPGREGFMPADLEGHRGLALPREVLAKIYHANLERLYGPLPAPLNREAALAELERLAGEVDALAGGEAEENLARRVAGQLEAERHP